MCRVVNDFVLSGVQGMGFGYFENVDDVAKYSEKVSRSQRRKWERHGIIPSAFWLYLREKRLIDPDRFIPEKHRTVNVLLDLLWFTPKRNQARRSEGEVLRLEMLKEMLPGVMIQTGSAQHLFIKAELYGDIRKTRVLKNFEPSNQEEVVVIRRKKVN